MKGGDSVAVSFKYPGRLHTRSLSFISSFDQVFFVAKKTLFISSVIATTRVPEIKAFKFKYKLPSILPLAAGSKAGTMTSREKELRVFKKDKYVHNLQRIQICTTASLLANIK